MQTILIDGSRYGTSKELHQSLQRMLDLPSWYGMNADALNDCLSERRETVHLWILSRGQDEVAEALGRVAMVIEDNGGTVQEL